MTAIKLRVAKLSTMFGVGEEYRYAIQLSEHGLVWSTVARFKTFNEALGHAKDLSAFIAGNATVYPESILWSWPTKEGCNVRSKK